MLIALRPCALRGLREAAGGQNAEQQHRDRRAEARRSPGVHFELRRQCRARLSHRKLLVNRYRTAISASVVRSATAIIVNPALNDPVTSRSSPSICGPK